ncbi:thermonuclease family protein [Streptomyces sp. NPDC006314]|uniref:thermonuclease family protein n=1 Tax=Streptomyces sp. NPDC006314 TaxID=3154475 RepID=UPI0033B9864F
MVLLVLEGTFRVPGAIAEGGTVRFAPDTPDAWEQLEGPHQVTLDADGHACVRLYGADTLETDFPTRTGASVHQPSEFADFAGTALMRRVRGNTELVQPLGVRGHVLTRGADAHGRCVAFVGGGPTPAPSGTRIPDTDAVLQQSANLTLLELGLAYPAFDRGLGPGIRADMAHAAASAREQGLGLWRKDVTATGAQITGLDSLADIVVMPALFRRLVDFLTRSGPETSLAGFREDLRQRHDQVTLISTGAQAGFDMLVSVSGQTVRLLRPPEDLVFDQP